MQLWRFDWMLGMCGNSMNIHILTLHNMFFEISYKFELKNSFKMTKYCFFQYFWSLNFKKIPNNLLFRVKVSLLKLSLHIVRIFQEKYSCINNFLLKNVKKNKILLFLGYLQAVNLKLSWISGCSGHKYLYSDYYYTFLGVFRSFCTA